MKKIILGAAVAFAAIFGGYTASQTSEMASLGLMDATDVEAEAYPGEVTSHIDYISTNGMQMHGPYGTGTSVSSYTKEKEVEAGAEGGANWKIWNFKASGKGKVTVKYSVNVLYFPCQNSIFNIGCAPYNLVTETEQ